MTTTYYVIMSGSRIADDAETYQAACDTSVIDWDVDDDFILVIQVGTSKGPMSRAYKLQWRDTDGGSFVDVSGSGAITFNATTSLVDDDPFTPNTGCVADEPDPENGLESEGDNILPDSGTFTHSDDYYTEFAFALDCSNAVAGHEYEFQLYDVTESQIIGTCAAKITMASALSEKGFADTIDGSDVFTQLWRSMGFADSISGSDVFQNLYRAMEFIDTISGVDVFAKAIILQAKAFVDTVTGADVFTLLRFLDFVDAIAGADVWTLTRPMDFVDTVSGSDVFSKATILQLKDFADIIAGADVFTIPFRAMGFIDTIAGTDVFDVILYKAFSDSVGGVDVWSLTRPMFFSDSVTGTDVFVNPYREMGFEDTFSGSDIFGLLRFLAFTDTINGSDAFILLRELGFADAVGGADVFSIPYREMGFSDTVDGADVFTQPYREMEFIDVILGTDVFASEMVGGIIEKFMVDSGLGYDIFTHASLFDFADSGAGVDVFLVTKPEIIVMITDGDFAQVAITSGELTQILITDGLLSQVKITTEDI